MISKIRIIGEMALITATPEFHPLRQLKKLGVELEANHFKGRVLFDLISVNGVSPNRFASISFDGHSFDRSSFSATPEVNHSIKEEQDDILKSDKEFLNSSVLSPLELEEFLH